MSVKIVSVLVLVVLTAGCPAAAGAKSLGNGGGDTQPGQPQQNAMVRGDVPRDPRQQSADPRQQYPDPRLQYPDPRLQYADPRQQNPDRQHVIPRPAIPVIVITQPVYVAAPPSCVVPGYWAYAWVPQSAASTVWAPGYYNSDALWVEGHYESRTYTWGYYQPYWVPERAC
jgi:hypothetical protein